MTKNKVVTLIAAGIALAAPAALYAAPDLDGTRSTLKEWVELKKLVSEEESQWRVEKETLNESIELLQKEIEDLGTSIEERQGAANVADQERLDLTEQEESLKQASSVVRDAIGDLERMAVDLVEYLPDSLKGKLKIVTQRIPRNENEARASSLSVRVMNVIGILTEIEKFNSQITIEESIQDINGEKIKVDTIYVGFAAGYYVDGTQSVAGVMAPAKGGWTKTENNELAEAIASAVAMQRREQQPQFVNLPLTIRDVE